MALIACWDGRRLELWDAAGERRFVFESGQQQGLAEPPVAEDPPANAPENDASGETASIPPEKVSFPGQLPLDNVDAPVAALLLPAEELLQRPFALPFEHPRFIDVDMLEQELADQAGAEEGQWWPAWQAGRVGEGVRGLVFALPQGLRDELSAIPVGSQCPYIGPDVAIRLAARLPQGCEAAALLDDDAEGLMLGVFADGVWRGMRRLNLSPQRDRAALANEAWASLRAMGFDAAAMPLAGRLDAAWRQAFAELPLPPGIDWQVDGVEEGAVPDGRHAANALALAALNDALPFNFRHGAWGMQTDWSKRFGAWRRSAVLLAAVCLLGIAHDAYQLHTLRASENEARSGIEQVFHKALPGTAMVDPMLQLQRAAGGGASADAWRFVRHLDAIAKLGSKEAGFKVQDIHYGDGEVVLTGLAPDFAAANRIRDALSSILGSKVDLLDTDLNGKQVRIRLRWVS